MSATKCHAITKTGTPCNAWAGDGSDYCYHHDPALASQRRQARRRGGRARHGRRIGPTGRELGPVPLETMADVATLLRTTITGTLQLENSLQRARTVGYLAGLLIKALDIAHLEERIARLERVLGSRE
jgi:hypothetical protein